MAPAPHSASPVPTARSTGPGRNDHHSVGAGACPVPLAPLPPLKEAIQVVPVQLVQPSIRTLDVGSFSWNRTGVRAIPPLHPATAIQSLQFCHQVLDDIARALVLHAIRYPSEL